MAVKKIFYIGDDKHLFLEEEIDYKYYGGFAYSQRQKCVKSLHESIISKYPQKKVLEISTKSLEDIGIKLSAFNLLYTVESVGKKIPVECIFQSSKCFEHGGPYNDIMTKSPKDAKRDERLRNSGELVSFQFEGNTWPLQPLTLFYDWIYINAIHQNTELSEAILSYDTFTDIEFNHKKSINCQARSAAIYGTLYQRNMLEDILNHKIDFKSLYI